MSRHERISSFLCKANPLVGNAPDCGEIMIYAIKRVFARLFSDVAVKNSASRYEIVISD